MIKKHTGNTSKGTYEEWAIAAATAQADTADLDAVHKDISQAVQDLTSVEVFRQSNLAVHAALSVPPAHLMLMLGPSMSTPHSGLRRDFEQPPSGLLDFPGRYLEAIVGYVT